MKRLVSVVLVLTMMLSVCAIVSAESLSDRTMIVPNPMDLPLPVSVGVRKNGTSGDFNYQPENGVFEIKIGSDGKARADYRSGLEMDLVKGLFDGPFIESFLDDAEAEAEFLAGTVKTEIDVVIKYPANAIFDKDITLSETGELNAGDIFYETGRSSGVESGVPYLKISYANDEIGVTELQANLNTYLKDIYFTLENVAYNSVGEYVVSVSLTGSSTITFDSKIQTVNYVNKDEASIKVKVTKEGGGFAGGGPTEPTNYTVTFELNGGTGVESVSVKANEKLEVSDPRKKGHIFKGWYTDESLTEKFDFDSAITKNIKLYAKWIKDTEIVGEECTGVTSGVCSIPLFYDLDPYQWYHLGCDYVIENKLMIGVATEKFAPLQNITRGMIATILSRREGVADFTDTYKPFDDVISGEYYTSHIAWAAENGVVLGYGDGNYGPEDPITREQMAAIIHRYFKYLNIEFEGEMEEIPYVDADQIQDYALEAVKFCYNMGIMVGKDASVFDPAGHATRAEVAVLIMRTFNK